MTTFRQAHLEGTSKRSTDLASLANGDYDLALVCSSWDARCLAVTAVQEMRTKRVVILLFDARDDQGLRDSHDPKLTAFAEKIASKITVIRGESTDLRSVWNQLSDELARARMAQQSPLSLFIDISTCPRFYSAATLAVALKKGWASRATLFYAEGVYPEPDGSVEIAFTGGRWSSVPIPGLEGLTDPGKERFYLVSAGFEGIKTFQAVAEGDPDRISLLLPQPGYREEYTARALQVNQKLVQEYCVPPEQILTAPAGDAIAAWAALARSPRERRDSENTFYLCCGTKPHAIALALRSLCLDYPVVLYNLPGEHRVIATQASGIFWVYEVSDVTALA